LDIPLNQQGKTVGNPSGAGRLYIRIKAEQGIDLDPTDRFSALDAQQSGLQQEW